MECPPGTPCALSAAWASGPTSSRPPSSYWSVSRGEDTPTTPRILASNGSLLLAGAIATALAYSRALMLEGLSSGDVLSGIVSAPWVGLASSVHGDTGSRVRIFSCSGSPIESAGTGSATAFVSLCSPTRWSTGRSGFSGFFGHGAQRPHVLQRTFSYDCCSRSSPCLPRAGRGAGGHPRPLAHRNPEVPFFQK